VLLAFLFEFVVVVNNHTSPQFIRSIVTCVVVELAHVVIGRRAWRRKRYRVADVIDVKFVLFDVGCVKNESTSPPSICLSAGTASFAVPTTLAPTVSLAQSVYDVKDVIFEHTKTTLWQHALQVLQWLFLFVRFEFLSPARWMAFIRSSLPLAARNTSGEAHSNRANVEIMIN
jgi:hypothetical protein